MGRYETLREHLDASTEPVLRLSIARIERILGDVLPPSARKHQAWWANEAPGGTHSHARFWLDAGYRTQNLDLKAQTVEFIPGAAKG
jgi:hypothetical protein